MECKSRRDLNSISARRIHHLSQPSKKKLALSGFFGAEGTFNSEESTDIPVAKYGVGSWVEDHAETLKLSEDVIESLRALMDLIKSDRPGMLSPEEIQPFEPDII